MKVVIYQGTPCWGNEHIYVLSFVSDTVLEVYTLKEAKLFRSEEDVKERMQNRNPRCIRDGRPYLTFDVIEHDGKPKRLAYSISNLRKLIKVLIEDPWPSFGYGWFGRGLRREDISYGN